MAVNRNSVSFAPASHRAQMWSAFVSWVLALACGGLPMHGSAFAGEAESGPAAGVKVMVFDVFGTVVDCRSSIIDEGQRLGKAKGLKVDWAAFADAWLSAYARSVGKVRKGELPWTRLDALNRMSLDELLGRFKIEGLSEEEKADFNRAWERLKPWPDTVEGLTRLRKRFVIAPLSNGNLGMMTNLAKHARLPWDCVLSAELVRHYKPDPEVYLSAAEFFGLKPGEVMMIAAHEGDLQVPKKLGMRTAYVHRRGEGPRLPPAGAYDFVVKDFLELAARLGL